MITRHLVQRGFLLSAAGSLEGLKVLSKGYVNIGLWKNQGDESIGGEDPARGRLISQPSSYYAGNDLLSNTFYRVIPLAPYAAGRLFLSFKNHVVIDHSQGYNVAP